MAIPTNPPAAATLEGSEGLSLRGPGAELRARLDRAARLVHAPSTTPEEGWISAVELLDESLRSWRFRYDDPSDPVDNATMDALVREAIALRTEALWSLRSLQRQLSAPPTKATSRTNPRAVAKQAEREAFLRTLLEEATYTDWRYGVPASVTLAQAILESSWGRSAPGYNLFGITGSGPAGTIQRKVVEYKKGRRKKKWVFFRAYNSRAESLDDHALLLVNNRAYTAARAVSEDACAFGHALTGRYASDPRYGAKLCDMMTRQGLLPFNWLAPAPYVYAPASAPLASLSEAAFTASPEEPLLSGPYALKSEIKVGAKGPYFDGY